MTGRKLVIITALALAATSAGCKDGTSPKEKPATNGERVSIAVTEKGFEPADVKVTKGEPVTLVFDRRTDNTCVKTVVINVDDRTKIERPLPLLQPVEVTVTFPQSGTITYACGMDMVKGSIQVQ